MENGKISFWLAEPGHPDPPATETLDQDIDVDVAVVGAGISGLWTAYALAQADPSLSIVVLEAERLGFGASGRNGGMLSCKPVGVRKVLIKSSGSRAAVRNTERRLRESMDHVIDTLGAEQIDARHGGWIQVARSPVEQARIEAYLESSRHWGIPPGELDLISAEEASRRVHVSRLTGALFSPDNYSLNPVKMVFRLADLVMAAGVRIFTGARVDQIAPGRLNVGTVTVRAREIVVATEAYTSTLPHQKRSVLPLNSSLLVTEPLNDEEWERLGWSGFESLAGSAHTYFYAKHTSDGRIAIGGRGRPYRYASGLDRCGEMDQSTADALMRVLGDIFPQVSLRPSHAWCGVIGLTRDWCPFVQYDEDAHILQMGGYVGYGLAAAHLAGYIAADLVRHRDTALVTSSPWVRPAPRRWEPEPLRWAGANGMYALYSIADRLEARPSSTGTSAVAAFADLVAGRS